MAHSCPECGQTCHCGGDIDDCCLEGTEEEMNCTCCIDKVLGDDEDDYFEGDPPDTGAK